MKTLACTTPDVNLLSITESISTSVEGDQIFNYTLLTALNLIISGFRKTEWLWDTARIFCTSHLGDIRREREMPAQGERGNVTSHSESCHGSLFYFIKIHT